MRRITIRYRSSSGLLYSPTPFLYPRNQKPMKVLCLVLLYTSSLLAIKKKHFTFYYLHTQFTSLHKESAFQIASSLSVQKLSQNILELFPDVLEQQRAALACQSFISLYLCFLLSLSHNIRELASRPTYLPQQGKLSILESSSSPGGKLLI